MADTSFPARFATANGMLNNTATNLFNQYTIAKNASGALSTQNTALQAEVETLRAKLANIKKMGDTYDREFLDRSAGKKAIGPFRRIGIITLQDWLLFIFFLCYAAVSISIILYAAAHYSLAMAGLVLIISFIIGVMMSAVMIRFI
jgi:hypothetical protein